MSALDFQHVINSPIVYASPYFFEILIYIFKVNYRRKKQKQLMSPESCNEDPSPKELPSIPYLDEAAKDSDGKPHSNGVGNS